MSFYRRFGCLGTCLVSLPLLLILAHVLTVRLPPYLRHPITVHVVIKDQSGKPIPEASMITHECGWRYFLPIPFSRQWMTHLDPRISTADSSGEIVVEYRQDDLKLDKILINGNEVKDYQSIWHMPNGREFIQQNTINEGYGYPVSKTDPWRRDYTIVVGAPLQKHGESGPRD